MGVDDHRRQRFGVGRFPIRLFPVSERGNSHRLCGSRRLGLLGRVGAAALCGFFPALTVPNNYLNMFAAVFAAASLGYLTGPESFCDQVRDRPAWQGKNWLFEPQCRLRYFPLDLTERQEMSILTNEVGKDQQAVKRALARIAALERRLETIGPAPNPQSPPPAPGPH